MAPRTTIEGQASEGLVIGLYPDTSYYFDVMVWNQAGNGPKSQYFIQRTLRTGTTASHGNLCQLPLSEIITLESCKKKGLMVVFVCFQLQ